MKKYANELKIKKYGNRLEIKKVWKQVKDGSVMNKGLL